MAKKIINGLAKAPEITGEVFCALVDSKPLIAFEQVSGDAIPVAIRRENFELFGRNITTGIALLFAQLAGNGTRPVHFVDAKTGGVGLSPDGDKVLLTLHNGEITYLAPFSYDFARFLREHLDSILRAIEQKGRPHGNA